MTATRLIVQHNKDDTVQVRLHHPGALWDESAGDPEPFTSPLSAQEREDLRWYLEDYLRIPVAVYGEHGEAIADSLSAWGIRLFNTLFGSGKPGRDAYTAAMAGEGPPPSLLLISNSPAFLGLPWELLRDPDHPEPLAFRLAGLDRGIDTAGQPEQVPSDGALRVLLVIARPYGDSDAGFRAVARSLIERLGTVTGKVMVEVLRPPTLDAMRQRLREAADAGTPFHILHFDGHGTFGSLFDGTSQPQGCLVFETDAGAMHLVLADEVALALKDGHVPVVVFNACRSGSIDGGDGPEAAVATRMVQAGAASVVAMSHTVYVAAAAEFMAAFYQALFEGRSVSQAVAAGRVQLHTANLRPSLKGKLPLQDWLVPVHYARRDVAFPHLCRAEAAGIGTPASTPDGAHGEGELSAMGGVFFGRDSAFQELERALRHKRVAVVHGPGGTGKTELAKAFARWWRDTGALERPELVFFHSFEPGVASFGLDGVVSSVGLRLFGPDFIGQTANAAQRRAVLLDVLRQNRLLLVWDNFESVHSMHDPQGVTPPLDADQRTAVHDFLAALVQQGRSAVIVTSRSPEPWLGDVHRLELGGLTGDEATEYADHLLASFPAAAPRRAEPAFADLMEALDGHPLSMRLVLPHLASRGPAALLEAVSGQGAVPATPGGIGRHASLDACIDYSLSRLPPEMRTRLPLVALFEGVADVGVLTVACRHADMPERFRGVSREDWGTLLDATAAVGLLTPLGGGMYALHPALPGCLLGQWRPIAADHADAEIAAGQRAFITAYAALGQWLLQQLRGGSAETAVAVLDIQRRSMGRFLGLALDCGAFDEAQNILQPLDAWFDLRGLSSEASGWARRCLLATEGPAATPPPIATPAGALWLFVTGQEASRAMGMGQLDKAQAAYDRLRHLLEASPGEEAHRHLAITYHQLGVVAQHRGNLPAAEDWYRKSLEIEKALGNRPGMAASYHQLGRVAQDRDNLPAAEDWYRKSLEIEEALGDRPGMAMCYLQLGSVAQGSGNLLAAEDWYRKSLKIAVVLGDRQHMAGSYHQLGNVAQRRGNLPAAEDWHHKALEIREALGNRQDMALSYVTLGVLHLFKENLVSALDWMIRAVALFPEFPHPATQKAPLNLAMLTAALGLPVLEDRWQRQTGAPLPDAVRAALPALTDQARAKSPGFFDAVMALAPPA
jgi:tetratricopeptide (TPR) repeat protein